MRHPIDTTTISTGSGNSFGNAGDSETFICTFSYISGVTITPGLFFTDTPLTSVFTDAQIGMFEMLIQ